MRIKSFWDGDSSNQQHKVAARLSKGGRVAKHPNQVDLLTVPEFLRRARISRSTLYALVRAERGPPLIKLGSRTFIDRATGDAWILSRQAGRGIMPARSARVGDKAVFQTASILRSLATPANLLITLALEETGDGLEIGAVAARTGLDADTIRSCLPSLRGIVVAQRTPGGATKLKLANGDVAGLICAVRQYYHSIH